MEDAPLVGERLARRAHALLAGAQSAKVLHRLRDGLAVEAHDNAAGGLVVDRDVKKHLVRDLRSGRRRLPGKEDESSKDEACHD